MYDKFLIAGATGGTGLELVKLLLASNKKVSIMVRNITKAKANLKEYYEKFDQVIEHDLGEYDANMKPEIEEAVKWCDVLINTVGPTVFGNTQRSDYFATRELINYCEKSNTFDQNKIFVQVSSLYVSRPYSIIGFLLNYMMPNVLGWKALAENILRQSKLNYLVVRPGGLTPHKNDARVIVTQGDRAGGRISRRNVAQGIIAALEDKNINKGKTTIDFVESKDTKFSLDVKNSTIKEDTIDDIITIDSFRATRSITYVLYFILTIIVLWIICKFKS